jgi:hypothetical protein
MSELLEDKYIYICKKAEQLLVEKLKLCGIIDCYLMGSESLEKIDVSARKLLEEAGYVEQDNS